MPATRIDARTERIRAIVAAACPPGSKAASDEPVDADAVRLRARWEERFRLAEEGDQPFEQRLADLGLTRDQLLVWLSPPLPEELPALPDWAELLAGVLDANDFSSPLFSVEALSAFNEEELACLGARFRDRPIFPQFAEPYVSSTMRRLQDSLDAVVAPSAQAQLARFLVVRLSGLAARTLAHELKQDSKAGRLVGDTPQLRYQHFFAAKLGTPAGHLALFERYPVLAMLIGRCCERFEATTRELLERFEADQPELQAFLGTDSKLPPIVGWHPGLSDPHRGWRTVCLLRLAGGEGLIYKPRSLSLDVAVNRLVDWWNQRTPSLDMLAVPTLDRGEYGWMKFIDVRPCETIDEVHDYYRRQGIWLAILHLLCGSDFHSENLIPHGAFPVIVDAEGLVMPHENVEDHELPPELRPLSYACTSTVMLPIWAESENDRPSHLFSAIGGTGDRKFPEPMFEWIGFETDRLRMHQVRGRLSDLNESLPSYDGQKQGPSEFIGDVERGFRDAYATILDHRDELLSPGGLLHQFETAESRLFLRPTRIYLDLLGWSTAPDQLTSGAAYRIALEMLCLRDLSASFDRKVLDCEIRQLWERDVPYFSSPCGKRTFRAPAGDEFELPVPVCSYERMRSRVLAASLEDLDWQCAVLRSTLRMAYDVSGPLSLGSGFESVTENGTRAALDSEAIRFGEALERLANETSHGATWFHLRPSYEPPWLEFLRVSPWLYDGSAGIGLFLANLAQVTGNRTFAQLSKEALRFARYAADYATHVEPTVQRQLSAFEGRGGLVYALVECGTRLQDEELLDWAAQEARAAETHVDQPWGNPDLLGGLAGLIQVLLHYHHLEPQDRWIDVAMGAAKQLDSLPRDPQRPGFSVPWCERPLGGLSHGQSGVALALMRLSQRANLPSLAERALEVLAYEDSLYSADRQDWLDLRGETPDVSSSWCNGSPGIGLARLEIRELLPSHTALDASLDRALAATERHLGEYPHHLCCGESGRIWFLSQAAARLERPGLLEMAQGAALRMIENGREHGRWVLAGVNDRNIVAPLMTGISGIGLALLQTSRPGSVSQVVVLD